MVHSRSYWFPNQIEWLQNELEEIETQLRQSEFVKEAIVVPVYKNDKVIHLIGAIVPTTEVTDNAEMTKNIKNDLKSRLPEYMIS